MAVEFLSHGKDRRYQRIGPSLYRRGTNDNIFARVRIDGCRYWLNTETTDDATARKVLKKWREDQILRRNGVEPTVAALERQRLTVTEALDTYISLGHPDRKMRRKKPSTVANETKIFNRLRPFFGHRTAVSLTLKCCDSYRDWRMSGGYTWERAGKHRSSQAGNRIVDIELQTLSVVLDLSVRQQKIHFNPLKNRTRYHREEETRHCREVAPTPQELLMIAKSLRRAGKEVHAACALFLAFSGLRINEALPLDWETVDRRGEIIHVKREKRGINPWVPIMDRMAPLLDEMKKTFRSHLLFPSPLHPNKPIAYSTIAGALRKVCEDLGIRLVTPHGLRSYFVTQCRTQLSDAEIAALIGDKSGAAIIARTYGDIRPDRLHQQAKQVRLLPQETEEVESKSRH